MGLDDVQGDRGGQRFERDQIYAVPVALSGRGVGISFPVDLGDADDGFAYDAVVVEGAVTLAHRAQVIAGLKIADSGPRRAAIQHELAPGIGGGFLLN